MSTLQAIRGKLGILFDGGCRCVSGIELGLTKK